MLASDWTPTIFLGVCRSCFQSRKLLWHHSLKACHTTDKWTVHTPDTHGRSAMCSCWHVCLELPHPVPPLQTPTCVGACESLCRERQDKSMQGGRCPKRLPERPYEERPMPCTASLSSRIPEISLQQAMYISNQDPMTQHGIGLASKPDTTKLHPLPTDSQSSLAL